MADVVRGNRRKRKKKRGAPAPGPQTPGQPTVDLGGGYDATFKLKHAPVARVDSSVQFEALLRSLSERAAESEERWCRCPRSPWIRELYGELDAKTAAEVRATCEAPEDGGDGESTSASSRRDEAFLTRWSANEALASEIVDAWFETRGLDDVLERSAALGHGSLGSGVVLDGELVAGLATGRDVSVTEVARMVEKLSPDATSLFKVKRENRFVCEGDATIPTSDVAGRLRDREGGHGSLDTTWDYGASGPRSGVRLLDEYYDRVSETLFDFDDDGDVVRLNPKAYLIFKQPRYCTPHHQDVHVPPHFTLYNQVSGFSVFHFLPLLVGLYAHHVGVNSGPAALADLLRDLERRRVGEVATVGPGQMLLILPFGSHGVFVPDVAKNAHLERFDLSLIRAVEIYLRPLYVAKRNDDPDLEPLDLLDAAPASSGGEEDEDPVDECIEFMLLAVEDAAERRKCRERRLRSLRSSAARDEALQHAAADAARAERDAAARVYKAAARRRDRERRRDRASPSATPPPKPPRHCGRRPLL